MDEQPPRTLPIESGKRRPLIDGLGSALKFQSCSPPRLLGQLAASRMLATSSSPPASSKSTFTSGFSARRRATTDPAEPDPHTMKSYCAVNSAGRRAVSWKLSKDNTHYLPSASYGVIAYFTLSRAAYWAMRKGRTLRYRTAGGPHLGISHILNLKVHFEAGS
jgi:hypothetical protein